MALAYLNDYDSVLFSWKNMSMLRCLPHAQQAILLIMILAIGFFGVGILIFQIAPVHASNVSIHLTGIVSGWNATTSANPTITVTQGDTVTISLTGGDSHPHQFLLDMNGDGASSADCNSPDPCSLQFTSSTSFSFTAGTAGTYKYYCTIHPGSMVGTFIIQQASNPPPSQNGDFTIALSPASQNIMVGSSGQFTVTIQSQNGFTGTVSISPSVSPSGPSVSASPSTVTISSAGGTGTSTITVGTSAGTGYYNNPTPNGAYTVTITAVSGTISHTAMSTVNVGTTSSNSPPNSNGSSNNNSSLDPTIIAGIIGGIVLAVVVIGSVVYLRRR